MPERPEPNEARDRIAPLLEYLATKFQRNQLTELALHVNLVKAYNFGWHDGHTAQLPEDPRAVDAQDIREVFDYWVQQNHKPRAKLTQDRRTKVRARLREGYTVTDLKKAVRGNARGAYIDGRGIKYNDLTLVCRSGSHVERYMSMDPGGSQTLQEKLLG